MIRRPPRSTLFPTRRSSDLPEPPRCQRRRSGPAASSRPQPTAADGKARSEEHTSELQSRRDLVCRLLLEKKKKKKNTPKPHTSKNTRTTTHQPVRSKSSNQT